MYLVTSDLHLTDRPRDAYRFGLFKWLRAQQEKYQPEATFILGDITDKKDRHSSKLVNRVADELMRLKPPVYVLEGNHDYIDHENPFFKFLNHIEGVRFIIEPEETLPGLYLIPHRHAQADFDEACSIIKPRAPMVMVHATFEGSISESGSRLSGFSPAVLESLKPGAIWAGDVHKPQRVGPVRYVGSPYHVRFGDDFEPRVLLLDDGVVKNLFFKCPRKWALTIGSAEELLSNEALLPKDQVKITIKLAREEAVEWMTFKKKCLEACKEKGLEVFGLKLEIAGTATRKEAKVTVNSATPKDVLSAYCKSERVGAAIKQAGEELLHD